MHRFSAHSDAPPAAAWALLARPDRWSEWAPHLRGAWGLADADGEVAAGHRGALRLLGVVPVPVAITAKSPGRSWTWRVAGAITMEHRVDPDPYPTRPGSTITITISAPAPLERALAATYGPLVQALLGRLSRSAAARPRPTGTGTPAG